MDSIPGFQTLLPAERIVEIVQEVGCVICGQTERMVPADRKLYALRDATGTVPSIPLITASILSKKLAESLDALILDVKFGVAAFMQTQADAHKLAKAMVTLGNECGVNVRAILTDMNTPLGRAAGNWLEVKESVALLDGASELEDLRNLVIECAAQLLVQTGRKSTLSGAREVAGKCLDSCAPRRKWDEMLAAQGANIPAYERKVGRDHTAREVRELLSPQSGYVHRCDARILGEVIRDLGGGRLTQESGVDYDVGVDRLVRPGEQVKRGAPLLRVHAATAGAAAVAINRLRSAFTIGCQRPRLRPWLAGVVTAAAR
jgi:pyrimidine-nucleoside phosphorylase